MNPQVRKIIRALDCAFDYSDERFVEIESFWTSRGRRGNSTVDSVETALPLMRTGDRAIYSLDALELDDLKQLCQAAVITDSRLLVPVLRHITVELPFHKTIQLSNRLNVLVSNNLARWFQSQYTT